ncbi:MAG: hypothetical protein V5A88_07370 [Candidatus Thermoplasmatota archaeon]
MRKENPKEKKNRDRKNLTSADEGCVTSDGYFWEHPVKREGAR